MNLHDIQKKVRGAKSQKNDFGGYKYRNAEAILAELKSVLPDGWTVRGTDDMQEVGGHLFLKHTVTIFDDNGTANSAASGWAMHAEQKKGMDAAQITGSCSTYAKKYALQNLLAIDDGSVDPDATNKHDDTASMAFEEVATQHLSQSELEDPIKVAHAYADVIEQKVNAYKKHQFLEQFMKSRKSVMDFIRLHDEERHNEVRSNAIHHLKTLKEGAK